MKKFLQFVSVLAIGLLMAPSGLEAFLCGSAGQSMTCPMAGANMGADCPMAGATANSNCEETCCAQHSLIKGLPWASPAKPKLYTPQLAITPLPPSPANTVAAFARPVNASASSPPRFILFQVFRI